MKALTNYSGEFDPNIKYSDFPKDFLLELLNGYAGYIMRVDAFWYLTVKDRNDDDEALACDMAVWDKALYYELDMTSKLFQINGNDVTTVMKLIQMSPFQWTRDFNFTMELKNSNHSIFTVIRCPMLSGLEKEGEGREQRICHIMEPRMFGMIAHYVNPEIKVQPIKLPPRKSQDEIACQWEFKLDRCLV